MKGRRKKHCKATLGTQTFGGTKKGGGVLDVRRKEGGGWERQDQGMTNLPKDGVIGVFLFLKICKMCGLMYCVFCLSVQGQPEQVLVAGVSYYILMRQHL